MEASAGLGYNMLVAEGYVLIQVFGIGIVRSGTGSHHSLDTDKVVMAFQQTAAFGLYF